MTGSNHAHTTCTVLHTHTHNRTHTHTHTPVPFGEDRRACWHTKPGLDSEAPAT